MFSSHLPLLKVNCPTVLNMQYFVDFVLSKQHATQLASYIVHVTYILVFVPQKGYRSKAPLAVLIP